MELFPLTASLSYEFIPIAIIVIISLVGAYVARKQLRTQNNSLKQTASGESGAVEASVDRKEYKLQRTATLAYLSKLESLLEDEQQTNVVSIYAAISYIVRQHVDSIRGTHTVSMSNEELRHLPLDDKFKDIIDECYGAEFSQNHGTITECKKLLIKAREFVSL